LCVSATSVFGETNRSFLVRVSSNFSFHGLLFSKWTFLSDEHANLHMRAIKEELGDNDDEEDDVAALERKMQNAGMPANIWKLAQREMR
jgi:hypothetical protein